MKSSNLIILAVAVLLIFAGCKNSQSPRDKAAAMIDNFESRHDPLGVDYARDPASADSLILLYASFANTYPDDSLAPVCLHKAANVASLVGSFDEAIRYAQKVVDDYSGYEAMEDCLLTLAKSYELAERPDDAKAAYQFFIDSYPNHPLTEDLKRTIALLDQGAVTPEEQLAAVLAANEQGK